MKTEYGEQLTDAQRHTHGQAAHGQAARDQRQQSTPGAMMAEHEKMALWVQPVLMLVGAWLLISPLTLGYRDVALVWSDVASGLAIIVLASLALTPVGGWAPYVTSLVGAWLLFAPLVFWAPTAAAYTNDTLIGALVIGLSLLIPHGMTMRGPDVPPGWSYNPSTWLQRAPIIALGFLGFVLSHYMAAFQLGYITTVWDPFFGSGAAATGANGTVTILQSKVSQAWPISDAGLGSTVYLLEVLMGLMGDPRRWRTMPWMVTFFGILVVPLGVTSLGLVILQPVAVGTWCTLCLIAALAMLIMIPLALDEVVAMLQFLAQSHAEGKSLWRTFWLGGSAPGSSQDHRAPPFDSPPARAVPAMMWGVSLPWSLVLSALLGIWTMAAPAIFGSTQAVAAADSNYIAGALVTAFTLIAWAEVGRAVRLVNVAFGAWLVIAPWLLTGGSAGLTWSNVIVGVAIVALSVPRGPVRERYGSWNRFVV